MSLKRAILLLVAIFFNVNLYSSVVTKSLEVNVFSWNEDLVKVKARGAKVYNRIPRKFLKEVKLSQHLPLIIIYDSKMNIKKVRVDTRKKRPTESSHKR